MEKPNLTLAQKKMMRSILVAAVLVSALIFVSIGGPKPKEDQKTEQPPAAETVTPP